MFFLLANETAEALRSFLASVIPENSENWWSNAVVPALSFQQQRMVEESQINSLSGLDLAALLRILDKNWYDIPACHAVDQIWGGGQITIQTRKWSVTRTFSGNG